MAEVMTKITYSNYVDLENYHHLHEGIIEVVPQLQADPQIAIAIEAIKYHTKMLGILVKERVEEE